MPITVLRSGKRPPAFVRGSLAWHRCRLCGAVWDRPEKSGNQHTAPDVCRACRAALREQEAP